MTNDILTGIPVAEGVIPESVENFSEAAMYVIENTENEFNDLLDEMGMLDENGALTESTEALDEASLGDVKDRFVGALESLWASIKSFFEKVIKWFKEKADQARAFLDDQVGKVKDKIEDVRQASVIKKFGDVKTSMIKAEDYKKMPEVHSYDVAKYIRRFETISQAVNSKIYQAVGSTDGSNEKAKESINSTVKDMIKTLADGDSNANGVATMKQSIKKGAIGDKRKVESNDYTPFYNIVLKNEQQKEVKQLYNNARKTIKESIANVKKANKADKTGVATLVSGYKTINQVLHAAQATICDVLKQRFNECTRTLGYMARAAAKNERKAKAEAKKKANASTEFQSLFGF